MNAQLERIAASGYGVYRVNDKFVVADPLDGPDGFYVVVDSIDEVDEVYTHLCDMELI